jgi:hypothetical protein
MQQHSDVEDQKIDRRSAERPKKSMFLAKTESKGHQEQYYIDIWVSLDHKQEVNEGTGGHRRGDAIAAEPRVCEMRKS